MESRGLSKVHPAENHSGPEERHVVSQPVYTSIQAPYVGPQIHYRFKRGSNKETRDIMGIKRKLIKETLLVVNSKLIAVCGLLLEVARGVYDVRLVFAVEN